MLALKKSYTLTDLTLDRNPNFDYNCLATFKDSMKINMALTRISLAHCDIDDRGMVFLIDCLTINKYLRSINL